MDVATSLDRKPIELIDRLHLFSAQVLHHPSRDATLATWQEIESELPLEAQTRLLFTWNKHLAGANENGEIISTVREVVRDLGYR